MDYEWTVHSWSRWFMVQVFRRTSRRDSVALASSECTVLSRPRFLPDGLKSESLVKKPASKSRKVFWGGTKGVSDRTSSSTHGSGAATACDRDGGRI